MCANEIWLNGWNNWPVWNLYEKLKVLQKLENQHIGSPAVLRAVPVSEMRPALTTVSSRVAPFDSNPPKIERGPPTEMTSDSTSAFVPSSSTCFLASSLTTASCTMGRSGGNDQQRAFQHPGLLRNRPRDD